MVEILFITIDRPEDIDPAWHQPNVKGLQAAAAATDPSFTVERITIDDLVGMDADALDSRWQPVAIFGAGSWSEWYLYQLKRRTPFEQLPQRFAWSEGKLLLHRHTPDENSTACRRGRDRRTWE